MTLTLFKNPKLNGIRYHELDDKSKQMIDEMDDMCEEIYYSERNWDLLDFFRNNSHVFMDSSEDAQLYAFIDDDNIVNVLNKLRAKIDTILDSDDRYDSETYGDQSDLFCWTNLYSVINKFKNKDGFDKWYLIIDAGW